MYEFTDHVTATVIHAETFDALAQSAWKNHTIKESVESDCIGYSEYRSAIINNGLALANADMLTADDTVFDRAYNFEIGRI